MLVEDGIHWRDCLVSRMTSSLDPFLGGRERLINLKFTGELENSLMKLLTKFQPAKLTRLGLIQISKKLWQNYDKFGYKKNKSKCVQRTLVAPLTVFYFSKYTKSLPHETMNDIEWPCTIEIQSFLYQMTDIPDRPQSIY